MSRSLFTSVLFVLAIATLAACANTDTTDPTTEDGDTQTPAAGIALTSDTLADTDVARMQFELQGVDCETGEPTDFSDQQTRDLEDVMLPGGFSQFENAPTPADSEHLFADAFFLVGAGCYNVQTQPLNDQGQASNDCDPASRDRVSVEDGQTTEIVLVHQCQGAQNGGIDVASTINHPPEIQSLEYQKFVDSCPTADGDDDGQQNGDDTDNGDDDATDQPQALQVCATATDPDGNPLEFAWQATDAGEVTGDITETTRTERDDGTVESCATLAVSEGQQQFRLRVFDLDGQGNRLEDTLADQSDQNPQSRADIQFPLYSTVDCPPADGEPEPEPEEQGRTVTMLFALSAQPGPMNADGAWLIQNAVTWVSPLDDPAESEILYIVDDNTSGKFLPNDRNLLVSQLRNGNGPRTAFNVDELEEPEEGIDAANLEDYDIVWFQNPDLPIDDDSTFDALQEFQQQGGGLILQGDDMAHAEVSGNRSMRSLTHLEFLNNGTEACGDPIGGPADNRYQVTYGEEPLPILEALRGLSFEYGNDIDHVRRTLSGEQPFATARYQSGDCTYQGPAAVAIDPADVGETDGQDADDEDREDVSEEDDSESDDDQQIEVIAPTIELDFARWNSVENPSDIVE